MNSRHILNTIVFGVGFLILSWFALFYGVWFVPSATLQVVAALIALPSAVYFSFWVMPSKRAAIGSYALPNTWVVKIGSTVFCAFVFWLPLALSIPAAITNTFGKAGTAQETVIHFYRSTSTCGQRLILTAVNPPLGGYCRAGPPQAFYNGEPIILTYKESVLGISVLAFASAKG